jgi:hypothetical protein
MQNGTDEFLITLKELSLKNLGPHDAFKNATKARNMPKQANEDQHEPDMNQHQLLTAG